MSKVQSHRSGASKDFYLCSQCYDEYRMGYIQCNICDSCTVEFIGDIEDGPVLCNFCSTYMNNTSEIDTLPDVTEDYERWSSQQGSVTVAPGKKCLRKAIREYVYELRRKEVNDKDTIRLRAREFFRMAHNLADNEPTVAKMGAIGREQGLSMIEFFKLMADYDRGEEVLDSIVSEYKERGYLAHDAVDNDWELELLGEKPTFLRGYLESYPVNIIMEADDPAADLPF